MSKYLPILFGIGLTVLLVACQESTPTSQPEDSEEQGIEVLLENLKALQKDAGNPFDEVPASFQNATQQLENLAMSQEEIRKDLLSEVKMQDRADFLQELEVVFNVGKDKAFFQRQIGYAKIKIDLAVVGIGIIRVDQVLKGANTTVKPKDTQEFIRYIKEQVQNAIISEDKNYKAVVFKGIESSA